jgi:hypothetical protein
MKSPPFFALTLVSLFLAVQAADDCCSMAFGKCSTCQPTAKRGFSLGVTALPRHFGEELEKEREIAGVGE